MDSFTKIIISAAEPKRTRNLIVNQIVGGNCDISAALIKTYSSYFNHTHMVKATRILCRWLAKIKLHFRVSYWSRH